jgi:hypothetical protein
MVVLMSDKENKLQQQQQKMMLSDDPSEDEELSSSFSIHAHLDTLRLSPVMLSVSPDFVPSPLNHEKLSSSKQQQQQQQHSYPSSSSSSSSKAVSSSSVSVQTKNRSPEDEEEEDDDDEKKDQNNASYSSNQHWNDNSTSSSTSSSSSQKKPLVAAKVFNATSSSISLCQTSTDSLTALNTTNDSTDLDNTFYENCNTSTDTRNVSAYDEDESSIDDGYDDDDDEDEENENASFGTFANRIMSITNAFGNARRTFIATGEQAVLTCVAMLMFLFLELIPNFFLRRGGTNAKHEGSSTSSLAVDTSAAANTETIMRNDSKKDK